MELAEYEVMYQREEDYWWYVGLRALVLSQIAHFARGWKDLTLLDAGCGTGKLLETCREYRAYGLELSGEAFRFLHRRGLENAIQASVLQMPFADASFDVVASLDVLYHLASPGDVKGLQEMSRVLKPGGMLLMNLPAYEFLRSHHDVAIHTQQRYTRSRVRDMLSQAGLRVRTLTYRNTLLFPVAALVRLAQKLLRPRPALAQSDLRPLPQFLNCALAVPLLIENRLIQMGLRLPFGLSVYCVAMKPEPRPAGHRAAPVHESCSGGSHR
jgi:SAM-dependent methyltransferase